MKDYTKFMKWALVMEILNIIHITDFMFLILQGRF